MNGLIPSWRARAGVLALAWAAGAFLGVCLPAAEAASDPVAGATNTLQSINVQQLSGTQVQLTLHLSAPATNPLAFTIDKPARIAFDLPNTTLALASNRIDVNSDGVDSILAAQANGRSRLVLDLDQPMPYQTRVDGDDIVVLLGSASLHGGSTALAGGTLSTGAASESTASPEQRTIKSIDFRRSPTGAAQLVVRLSDPHTPVDLRQQGSQVVVDFAGTALPRRFSRRYDTLDFGTPVTGFEAESIDGSTRIVMDATGNFDQLAYQTDDQYVVEVSPIKQAAQPGTAEVKKTYKGERLTLNFQDISTRAVLQLLADASGQNIVVADSVSGNVTLRLQNVPWDQALDIVLTTKGLGKRQDGNVIIVAPADELAAREKADLASQQDIQQLEPLTSEYLQVNYAKAADIAALLKTKNGGTASLLSSRGSVSVDDRTNTLLVQDTADRLASVRRLVATLDVPVKQVEIEARIVIVSNDFERNLGAILGVQAQNSGGTLLQTSGTTAGLASTPQQVYNSMPSQVAGTSSLATNRQREPAGDHQRGQHCVRHPEFQLPGRPRVAGRADRESGHRDLLTARGDGQPAGGIDQAGHRNSLSAVGLERRNHDRLQGCGAAAEGQAADHARQSHHPRSAGVRRCRGSDHRRFRRRERAGHRHACHPDPGAAG